MTTISKLLSADWALALGWTLLHSIWQALATLLIVVILMRVIPARFSGLRYLINCGGLFIFLLAALLTFSHLNNYDASYTGTEWEDKTKNFADQIQISATGIGDRVAAVSSFVNANMTLVLGCWMAGFLFSVLRLSGSVYWTYKLRATALPVENLWSEYIKTAGRRLGVRRLVRLAESASISTPVVIGYMKPIIVIPLGMLTGLTAEQLETIFVHELAHIKRHDYLVNLLQSLVETIFFFNPFILILSGLLRREREYCCDDLVISQHGGARAYAHALTRLAEVRLLTPAFVLPLANSKNQLLNRIRRIMEKSAKDYSTKHRIVIPAIFLVAGLLCVSWLGINADNGSRNDGRFADQDTVKKQSGKTATYLRKSIITIDEHGEPHEEIVEEFEGDESLRPLMAIPDISMVPPIPNTPVLPPLPDISGLPDTIPPPSIPFKSAEEWEEFSRSIEEQIKGTLEKISDLRDGEGFQWMEKMKEEFDSDPWRGRFFHDSTALRNLDRQLQRLQEFELEGLHQQLERLQEFDMKNLQEQLERMQEPLRELENELRHHETDIRKFEEGLREALIEDGYLQKDEAIESIEWSDDSFKVNGKEIRERDRAKYEELRKTRLE